MSELTSAQQVSIKDAYVRFWLRWRDYHGRSSRQEFWKAFLVNIVVAILVALIAHVIGMWFDAIVALASLVPSVTLLMRRLHDAGHTGKWVIPLYVGDGLMWVSGLLAPHTVTPGAVSYTNIPLAFVLAILVAFLLEGVIGLVVFIFTVQRSSSDNSWGALPL